MCEYCDIATAEGVDIAEELIYQNQFSTGVLGCIEITEGIERDADNDYILATTLFANGLEVNCDSKFANAKIKYCPICGRKLGENENV